MTVAPSVLSRPGRLPAAAPADPAVPAAAADRLAEWLIQRHRVNTVTSVTWLNHYSVQVAMARAPQALGAMDVVGLDGLLLCGLVGGAERTSADLVAPLVLPRLDNARVLLLGGAPECAAANAECIGRMLAPGSKVVGSFDGYDGLPTGVALADLVAELRPTVVLVGIGAAKQEQVAAVLSRVLERGLVMTCGGYFDQARMGCYYPSWAFPLRLNWLVRLVREPTRLWRRYSVDALRALGRRREMSEAVRALPGFQAYESILAAGRTADERPAVVAEVDVTDRMLDLVDRAERASAGGVHRSVSVGVPDGLPETSGAA